MAQRVALLLVLATAAGQPPVGRWTTFPTAVPSHGAVDGPLLGNGALGVVVGGAPQRLSWHFGLNQFFRATGDGVAAVGGLDLALPDAGWANATFTARQFTGNGTVAATLCATSGQACLHTVSFVHPRLNLMVTTLRQRGRAVGPMRLQVAARAGPLDGFDVHLPPYATTARAGADPVLVVRRSNGFVWQRAYAPGGLNLTDVAVAVRAVGAAPAAVGVKCGVYGPCNASGTVTLRTEPVVVLSAVICNRDIGWADPVAAAVRTVASVGPADVPALRDETAAHWSRFWSASAVELSPDLRPVQDFWYGALYILALCSRGDQVAPGLYGPFVTSDGMGWRGDLTLNYNYEATFYGAVAAGHPELLTSYFPPILDYRRWARVWARDIFGQRGVHYPGHILPLGHQQDMDPGDNGQRSNALFASVLFVQHWQLLRDAAMARGVLFPFLQEVLAFWQGYLTKRATPDGYVYASVNDCFMERCGLTTDGRGPYGIYDPTRLNVNPIQTVAMLRYVLEGAIDMGSALGLGAAELPQYRDILRHLPPLPTAPLPKPHAFANATRVFVGAESAAPSPPGSNPVETSALFPGASIGLSSDPSLLQTAQATVLWLDSFATGNSFPQIFAAAGRVAPPSGPLNASFVQRRFLQRLHGDSAPSFYVHQFGGGVETVGALAYVNEMLLQSHEGFIRLFPGIALGLRAVGNFVVAASISDTGAVEEAMTFCSGAALALRLVLPDSATANRRCEALEVQDSGSGTAHFRADRSVARGFVTWGWSTRKGACYSARCQSGVRDTPRTALM